MRIISVEHMPYLLSTLSYEYLHVIITIPSQMYYALYFIISSVLPSRRQQKSSVFNVIATWPSGHVQLFVFKNNNSNRIIILSHNNGGIDG